MCLYACLPFSVSELCYLGLDQKGYQKKISNDI